MDSEDIEAALRASVEDAHLSRGERKALRELLAELELDAHRRSLLRGKVFQIAREELEGPRADLVLGWLEDVLGLIVPLEGAAVPAAGPTSEVWFSPGTEPLEAILREFRRVRRSADICVFTITDDRISDGLAALARRGVEVRILSDDDKAGDLGSDLRRLVDAGLAVALDRSSAHMHHKFAIFDRARLLTGSFNWTRSASGENHENLLVTDDARLVQRYSEEFDRLWARYG